MTDLPTNPGPVPPTLAEIDEADYPALRRLAKLHGLPASGSASDLAAGLRSIAADAPPSDDVPAPEDVPAAEVPPAAPAAPEGAVEWISSITFTSSTGALIRPGDRFVAVPGAPGTRRAVRVEPERLSDEQAAALDEA